MPASSSSSIFKLPLHFGAQLYPTLHTTATIADVETTIADGMVLPVAVTIAEAGKTEEHLAENTGVRAHEDDYHRDRQWVVRCLSDPVQMWVEDRLGAPAFSVLLRWLNVRGLQGGSVVSAEERLCLSDDFIREVD
jgi:hypothetical protein